MKVLSIRESRRRCEKNLINFVREAWHVVEPGNPFIYGWHLSAIAWHLEAVSNGEIKRLLINVPPGMMKSLMLNVFWPAWEWTRNPHLRYVATAHNQALAIRDSTKMRRLIMSKWYQERWPDVVLTSDQNAKTKFENSAFGFREAVAFESMTGVRGDRVMVDDPHSVTSAESDVERQTATDTFLEAVPTRLTNPATSAIVVIMQRLHESDISGVILSKGLGYTHLCLPMEYDPSRHCETEIGFSDPRSVDGDLLFPERFPREVVERDKEIMGPYASAGQFQQQPSPRGGGLIRRDWWRLWDEEEAGAHGVREDQFPPCELIVASLDGAFSEKQNENSDFSALTIWGVFNRTARLARAITNIEGVRVGWDDNTAESVPAAILMHAWQKRLPMHGPDVERLEGETDKEYRLRTQPSWGLVEHVADACRRFKVDLLLIEGKGPGLTVAQEFRRLNKFNKFGVRLIDPGRADKVARVLAVQHIWSGGQVWCPDRAYADMVITQCEQFPRGAHDDLTDSATQALKYLRDSGVLDRPVEVLQEAIADMSHSKRPRPIYEA